MRRFMLARHHDATGISGTGFVAEGIQFLDGRVALRWIVGDHRSTVTYDAIDSVEAIHGHNGATEIIWLDADHPPIDLQRWAKIVEFPQGSQP